MNDRTPTTEAVRDMAVRGAMASPNARTEAEAYARFDHWLAGHDREVREQVAQDLLDMAEFELKGASTSGESAAYAVYRHAARIARERDQA